MANGDHEGFRDGGALRVVEGVEPRRGGEDGGSGDAVAVGDDEGDGPVKVAQRHHDGLNKLVGPSFQDVAARYRGDDDVSSRLAESIRAGGTGKWGQAAMPPMSALSATQAQALAEFVLAQ